VDKFSHLPAGPDGGAFRDPKGPDCCYYYQAFLNHVDARLRTDPPASTIQAEMFATKCLRALVARHFYLSCLESRRRSQRLVRRYIWKMDGHVLYVWLPIGMPGHRCRTWLQANIPDVQPGRPGEQERVQAIVNRLLSHPRFFSIDTARRTASDIAVATDPVGAMAAEEVSSRGLADTIADEKAENIDQQRPAIRQLGEERLRQLIQDVFEGLAAGDFQADRIAGRFGLSEATLSRFAGSRWRKDGDESARVFVPDLYRNTAQALALHPDFAAAAKCAGVWKRVTDVLNAPATGRKEYE
jgi:hypothetical protein